ncbi:hypothetical protein GCM10018780_04710 [Streptomyces lanatus]|nr:hypothetical protein GCM10018780_04710 [Streptomyces lanatus]
MNTTEQVPDQGIAPTSEGDEGVTKGVVPHEDAVAEEGEEEYQEEEHRENEDDDGYAGSGSRR